MALINISVEKRINANIATLRITCNGRTWKNDVTASKVDTGVKLCEWLRANREEIIRMAREQVETLNLVFDTETGDVTLA